MLHRPAVPGTCRRFALEGGVSVMHGDAGNSYQLMITIDTRSSDSSGQQQQMQLGAKMAIVNDTDIPYINLLCHGRQC